MAETINEALEDDKFIIGPEEIKEFVYTGGSIPFDANLTNLDNEHAVRYFTRTLPDGLHNVWTLYGDIPPGGTVSLQIDWFDQIGVFGNLSLAGSIKILGGDIQPYNGSES
jgi:hypothetical protein